MTAAFESLRARIEPAITQTAPSVMDKMRTPPSGDKHDFMSIGPYWWPNPDTSDGLPYVRRDGEIHPDRFTNATDVNALRTMVENANGLLLAFALTGEARYVAAASAWLRTWFLAPATRMNPHLRYAQAIPGRCDGRGIGIIDTTGFIDLLRTLRAVSPAMRIAGEWSVDDDNAMRTWVSAFVDWLLSSPLGLDERREHNNHGTWYDAQVAWFALYADRPSITFEIVSTVLTNRIARHIEPDGSQPHELARTRPIAYACFNLRGLMELADAGAEVGIDLWNAQTPDGRSIRRACEWFASTAIAPQPGHLDSLEERQAATYAILRRAANAYPDDGRFVDAARKLPSEIRRASVADLTHPNP